MTADEANRPKAIETTPLLPSKPVEAVKYGKYVLYRALLCGFLVSVSFGVTQVPIIYIFRLMTCEHYYKSHAEPTPGLRDRCSVHDIESSTARAVGLLGASTTLFGVLNLLITGWSIKKYGCKTGLLLSVFWPAIRLAVQNIGVMTGGNEGIIIIQLSQIITILGGPAGYLLALNSYVTEIIEPSERTGALGELQGSSFLGTALAYLMGGLISDLFGIAAPFRVTLVLFLASSLYVLVALPWIPPNKAVANNNSEGLARFFGPLKLFTPQKWILKSGRTQTEYGTILLAIGVFLGVLATGYIPVLLQMYATDVYQFGTTENGYLISLNSFIRGLFLTLVFPRFIALGRAWMSRNETKESTKLPQEVETGNLPTHTNDFAAIDPLDRETEPLQPPALHSPKETFEFDLLYTRYSLLTDALLTGGASFVSRGWQMYLVSAILPFAAGTGASAKGTILQMCDPSERADALSAITLVEMVAKLTTTSVFGLIFAAFVDIGKVYLVFTCNGAVALIGFFVLLFSRFPPEGSERFEGEENTDDS